VSTKHNKHNTGYKIYGNIIAAGSTDIVGGNTDTTYRIYWFTVILPKYSSSYAPNITQDI